jgi:hypothetical protein
MLEFNWLLIEGCVVGVDILKIIIIRFFYDILRSSGFPDLLEVRLNRK